MSAKQHSIPATVRYSEKRFGGWYLEFDEGTHLQLGLEPNSRVLLQLSNEEVHRGLRRSANGYDYIGLGIAMVKREGWIEDQKIMAKLREDTSEYGMGYPEEMHEVMEQDPEGKSLFERMTPGQQRGFLHYVSSAKGIDTRIKRALHLMQRVRELEAEGRIK